MKYILPSIFLFSTLLLSACGGGNDSVSNPIDTGGNGTSDTPPSDSSPIIERSKLSTGSITAPTVVYYDLETASEVNLSEDEAAASDDWDIAFKRTDVYLNNMASEPVSLYFLNNVDAFYDAESDLIPERFTEATASEERINFENLSADITDDVTFHTDEVKNIVSDFYLYDPINHTVSANIDSYFIISSDDAITKFNVTDLVQDGFGLSSITFNTFYQAEGENLFSVANSLTVDAASCVDNLYIDFDSSGVTTVDGDWDIYLPCNEGLAEYEINLASDALALSGDYAELNGIDGENFPFYDWTENQTKVLAIDAFGDPRSSYGWGEYGVNGGHVIWPNFATYIIQTETARYKFQITSYYDSDTGAAGSFSIRHQLIVED